MKETKSILSAGLNGTTESAKAILSIAFHILYCAFKTDIT